METSTELRACDLQSSVGFTATVLIVQCWKEWDETEFFTLKGTRLPGCVAVQAHTHKTTPQVWVTPMGLLRLALFEPVGL